MLCERPTVRPLTLSSLLRSVHLVYFWLYIKETTLGDTAQKRALDNYRRRLGERGMARFEVLGLDTDRELIRSLARRLAQDDPEAAQLRAQVSRSLAGKLPDKGGILAAPRRSPLVGADLEIQRDLTLGRDIDL